MIYRDQKPWSEWEAELSRLATEKGVVLVDMGRSIKSEYLSFYDKGFTPIETITEITQDFDDWG